jgi:hypothetical protein
MLFEYLSCPPPPGPVILGFRDSFFFFSGGEEATCCCVLGVVGGGLGGYRKGRNRLFATEKRGCRQEYPRTNLLHPFSTHHFFPNHTMPSNCLQKGGFTSSFDLLVLWRLVVEVKTSLRSVLVYSLCRVPFSA